MLSSRKTTVVLSILLAITTSLCILLAAQTPIEISPEPGLEETALRLSGTYLSPHIIEIEGESEEVNELYNLISTAYEDLDCRSVAFDTDLPEKKVQELLTKAFGGAFVFDDLRGTYTVHGQHYNAVLRRQQVNGYQTQIWIRDTAEDIREALGEDAGDMDVIQAVNDRICREVEYTGTNKAINYYPDSNAAGAVQGGAICSGYAKLFTCLMVELGYKTAYISGETEGGYKHAWNEVYLNDGSTVYVDVTWNDENDGTPYLSSEPFEERTVSRRTIYSPLRGSSQVRLS